MHPSNRNDGTGGPVNALMAMEMEKPMKKLAMIAALPLGLAVAACGEPLDGSDTADLAPETTTAETGPEDAGAMNPADDGMLDTDVETVEDTMEDPMAEDSMTDQQPEDQMAE